MAEKHQRPEADVKHSHPRSACGFTFFVGFRLAQSGQRTVSSDWQTFPFMISDLSVQSMNSLVANAIRGYARHGQAMTRAPQKSYIGSS